MLHPREVHGDIRTVAGTATVAAGIVHLRRTVNHSNHRMLALLTVGQHSMDRREPPEQLQAAAMVLLLVLPPDLLVETMDHRRQLQDLFPHHMGVLESLDLPAPPVTDLMVKPDQPAMALLAYRVADLQVTDLVQGVPVPPPVTLAPQSTNGHNSSSNSRNKLDTSILITPIIQRTVVASNIARFVLNIFLICKMFCFVSSVSPSFSNLKSLLRICNFHETKNIQPSDE